MTTYSPQKHAQQLADWSELIKHLCREVAGLRGDVTRLLAMQQANETKPDPAFDDLIGAAWMAMGTRTWLAGELLGRSLHTDKAGLALLQATTACGKGTTRALGRLLAQRVPGDSYLTPSGLELRRVGQTANMWAWTIAAV